jgi:hypothetical protein
MRGVRGQFNHKLVSRRIVGLSLARPGLGGNQIIHIYCQVQYIKKPGGKFIQSQMFDDEILDKGFIHSVLIITRWEFRD